MNLDACGSLANSKEELDFGFITRSKEKFRSAVGDKTLL